MPEDQTLVQEVLARRRGAFERLVNAHQRLVWQVVFRLVQHPEDARDLCQETFLLVHRKLSQYRGDSSLSSWIARIAFNLAIRHLQRNRLPMQANSKPFEDDEEEPLLTLADDTDLEHAAIEQETYRLLRGAIARLPPMQRLLLGLYHSDEMSITDIAAMTGQPEGTVKNHLFRARHRLRGLLEAKIGEVV